MEQERRAYWTRQMEDAACFMEQMRTYPLKECSEEMASLVEAAEGLEVHFSTTLINQQYPRVFHVRAGLIDGFRQFAREMNERGWILKIEDGYRSPEMQRAQSHNPRIFDVILQKVIWELEGAIPTPEMMLRRMSALIATRCRVGTHVSGSAIDISVFDRATGRELERGGEYLEISERTPMASPFITIEENTNRIEIQAVLRRHGWVAYPYEFWHFSSGDSYAETLLNSGKPARYGPIVFEGGKVQPMLDVESDALLEPVEFYERQIVDALSRF